MAKKKKISALQEIKGVSEENRLNSKLIAQISKKKNQKNITEIVQGVLKGNIVALSKAITLIESNLPKHFAMGQEIIKSCLAHSGKSVRIGITGVPGVGKSTFIESLGKYYTTKGHKVAVLAIDPSSSLSKGSILGDKTRMEELSRDENAYIRPSPSGNNLGGVARKTRETILLCEAAGFDRIIVETVGVGQSETMAHSMVDFFLLLKLAGAGDELQGIKRGIIEMADLIVINKAEADNLHPAKLAQKAFQTALHYFPLKESSWSPKVLLASALHHQGTSEIATEIDRYIKLIQANGYFDIQRNNQQKHWLMDTINRQLQNAFFNHNEIENALPELLNAIKNNKITAFEAADKLMQIYTK